MFLYGRSCVLLGLLCYGLIAITSAQNITQVQASLNQCNANLNTCENRCLNGGTWNPTTHQCMCPHDYVGLQCERHPIDCTEAYCWGRTGQGSITIQPKNWVPIVVWCEFDYGGWTFIERRGLLYRKNGPYVSFDRTWNDYKSFFGQVNAEHFIGLENAHALLAQADYKLSASVDFDQAYYHFFSIDGEANSYRLHYALYEAWVTNPLADGLGQGNIEGKPFCSADPGKDCAGCAAQTNAPWWFGSSPTCDDVNLHLPEQNGQRGSWPTYPNFQGSIPITNSSYMMVMRIKPDFGDPLCNALYPMIANAVNLMSGLSGGQPPPGSIFLNLVVILSPLTAGNGLQLVNDTLVDAHEFWTCINSTLTIANRPLPSAFALLLEFLGEVLKSLAEALCKLGRILVKLGNALIALGPPLSDLGTTLVQLGNALIDCCDMLEYVANKLIAIAQCDCRTIGSQVVILLAELLRLLGECLCRIGNLIRKIGAWFLNQGSPLLNFFGGFIDRLGQIIFQIGEFIFKFGEMMERLTRVLLKKMKNCIAGILERIGGLLEWLGRELKNFIDSIIQSSPSSLLAQLLRILLQDLAQLGEIIRRIGEILKRLAVLLRLHGFGCILDDHECIRGQCVQTNNVWACDCPSDYTGPRCEDSLIVDGGWSGWDDTTSCTVTCGGGTKNQARTCTNPPPSNGGALCPGPVARTVPCNVQGCPVTTTTTEATTTTEGCSDAKADIIFLVDKSSSVGAVNFQTQRDFLASMVDEFQIGEDFVKMALVTFSTNPNLEFNLDDHTTDTTLKAAFNGVSYTGGWTRLGLAINYTIANALVDARSDARTILVVLTDGRSTYKDRTLHAAQQIPIYFDKSFAIGIGGNLALDELNVVASSPDNVFTVAGFDALEAIKIELAKNTC